MKLHTLKPLFKRQILNLQFILKKKSHRAKKMTTSEKTIQDFLQLNRLAVAGVSRDRSKFGNMIYRELKRRGYQVMAVNPNAEMVEGDRCYAGLRALPEKPEGVVLVLPAGQGIQVIEDAATLGIRNIWIQVGAESPELLKHCSENNLVTVSGECIFMHLEPVRSVHGGHHFFRRLFGGKPK